MKIVVSVLAGFILVLGVALGVVTNGMGDQIGNQNQMIYRLGNQVSSDSSQMSLDENTITDLQNKVSNLNTPTDPLSSYNQICNIDGTNNQGVPLIYYYPCTSNIIPAPLGG